MPARISSGQQLIDGSLLNQIILQMFEYQNGITAHAGGGQASGVNLTAGLNSIDTVATDHDSVKLPAATPNPAVGISICCVMNNGASVLDIYPQSGQKIAQGAGDAKVSLNAGKSAIFFCAKAGVWAEVASA